MPITSNGGTPAPSRCLLRTPSAHVAAVFYVARMARPDPTPLIFPGVNDDGTFHDLVHVLIRNLLVLALHAMACVAGFIAGSSLPQQASSRSGLSKLVHEKAGPLAIGFVCCATVTDCRPTTPTAPCTPRRSDPSGWPDRSGFAPAAPAHRL